MKAPDANSDRTIIAILCGALTAVGSSGGYVRPSVAQPAEPGAQPVLQAGLRIATGQVAVVGGNSAGARERALDAALRQAVEQALGEILDAQTRVVQARAIKTLEGRARTFVKRYRTLEEGEANGLYSVRIEAEVDDVVLRRATERWTPQAAMPGAVRAPAPSMMVLTSGAAAAGPAIVAALAAVGVKAQLGDPTVTDPARALQAATRAMLTAVAFVSASVTDEGPVRGPGKEAIACRIGAKVLSVPTGQPLSQPSASARVFADHAESGRAECLKRAAVEISGQLQPPSAAGADGADLRAVTVDAEIVEPAAVTALLKTLRGLGSVSSAELRRIAGGRSEIRVRTRLPGAALATALSRDSAAVITLSNVEVSGDQIRVRVRLRPASAGPAAAVPSSPSVP
jgi:hypothetical protein